jgi:hypothetical protein
VQIGDLIDLSRLGPEDDDEPDHPRNAEPVRVPRRRRRKVDLKVKRIRKKGRKNINLGSLDVLHATLRDPGFFATAALLRLPNSKYGPNRECNEIQVHLWERMIDDFDSWRDAEAFFAHPLINDFVVSTLEQTWPDHPDRRVPNRPMSRSQFHRYRRRLGKSGIDTQRRLMESQRENARRQALSMGLGSGGSLAKPDPKAVMYGDGTFIKARYDAIEGDKVEDPRTGEVEQARYDLDAVVALDDDGNPNPGYTWVILHLADPDAEQECVLTGFDRVTSGGEAAVVPRLLEELHPLYPGVHHCGYDMAVQGRDIDRLYASGIHPAIKIPRAAGDTPRHGLIEIKDLKGTDGKTHKVKISGFDGVACIEIMIDGEPFLVPVIEVALRQPDHRVYGEYEIPPHPGVHRGLHGVRFQIRLDGLTIHGRYRAQYVRWINEHTPVGQQLIPQRNRTESENSNIERMLHLGGRARSVGEFNNTLDMIGYCETRNLKAALAHQRRTGHDPIGLGPPGDPVPNAA